MAKIIHLPTADMTADLLTKPMTPKLFLRLRDKLMNSSAPSAAPPLTLAGGCQLHDESTSLESFAMLTAVGIPPITYCCQHPSSSAVSASTPKLGQRFLVDPVPTERSSYPNGTFLGATTNPESNHNRPLCCNAARNVPYSDLLKAFLNIG
jgi:hypothetical protein